MGGVSVIGWPMAPHKVETLFGDTVRLRDVVKEILFSIEVPLREAQSCVGTDSCRRY